VGTRTIFLLSSLRVVVHNLNVFSAALRPTEADAKLIVDANAVLPLPISLEGFQTVSRRHVEILQG